MSSNEAFRGRSIYGNSFGDPFAQLHGVSQYDPYDYQRQLQRQQMHNTRITSQLEVDYQAEIAKAEAISKEVKRHEEVKEEEEIYYLLS